MAHVEMYTTHTCPYCVRAKRFLAERGVGVEEIDVSMDRSEMTARTGGTTVPQIVINGTPIGGFDNLVALDREGKLDPMLAEA
jgi:glutaredoxin 3